MYSNQMQSLTLHAPIILIVTYRAITHLFVLDYESNCGKFWKRWEYQATWSASWETCMQARKQQLELDMEQQTGSK